MFDRLIKSEHQRVEEMLSGYLDGELSRQEQAMVERHLARCSDCAQNLHTLRQTVAVLGQLPPVAVPRSFAIRPVPVAPRPGLFQTRRAYVYLRGATALAAILLAVVLAGDAFFTGLAPYLTPAREVAAPAAVVMREVEVEKAVQGVEADKEVAVEATTEAPVVESEPVYAATPSAAPAEKKDELVLTRKPLPTPAAVGKGIEVAPAAGPPSTPEGEVLAEAPLRPEEERIEATAISTTLPADVITTAEPTSTPTAMPTAVVEVLPPAPLPQEPTVPAVARPSRSALVQWRVVEASLLSLVLALAIATLVAKRRQGAK